ncbi:MAG: VWA domain-containing protein [Proteobacteria bacterium]|nr:VWA domain-containing protein [Pseudomonadota bacterium]
MAQEVMLDVLLSYQNVLVTSERKLLYLLAEVRPGEAVGAGPAALNLAIVLDKSGSMYAARKLEYVKNAVQFVIDQLRPTDLCSIIAFADKARVLIPSGQLYDKEQAKRMIKNIDQVDVGSGTEMLKGIEAAVSQVRNAFSPDRMNHVVILTDGLTQAEKKCHERCLEANRDGISVSTIGVGDDFNEELLLGIANGCRGKSYYIDDPRDIPQIFADELQGVQSVVVRNPRIKLKLAKDIGVRRAFKVKPLINDLGQLQMVDREATVQLADLQSNEVQSTLFELELPSRQAGTYRVAQVEATYDLPSLQVRDASVSRDVLVGYTPDPALASVVTPQVMNVVDLVSVFRQQTRALELAQAGDRAKATQLLRSAATTLLERGQGDLAQQALQEAQRIETGAAASSAGTKKLQYGTRKLTQLLDQVPLPPTS